MDVIRTAQDLIRFRTETGNLEEIRKCFAYIADLLTAAARWSEFLKTRHCSGTVFKQQRDRRL